MGVTGRADRRKPAVDGDNSMRRTLIVAAIVCLMYGANPQAGYAQPQYNRDIRPILAENCFACHGPDSASRKAKLRIDHRDAAIQAGVIVPGDPAKSELIKRV